MNFRRRTLVGLVEAEARGDGIDRVQQVGGRAAEHDWSDCDHPATQLMELASTSRPSRVASSRDFPVPREIARRIDSGETPNLRRCSGRGRHARSGRTPSLRRSSTPWAHQRPSHGAARVIRVLDVSAEAYFLSGPHPSGADTLSALIDILRQAAEQVTAARRVI